MICPIKGAEVIFGKIYTILYIKDTLVPEVYFYSKTKVITE
jgi:hypothetical protein